MSARDWSWVGVAVLFLLIGLVLWRAPSSAAVPVADPEEAKEPELESEEDFVLCAHCGVAVPESFMADLEAGGILGTDERLQACRHCWGAEDYPEGSLK